MLDWAGHIAYQGPAADAVAYFAGLDFNCPLHWNPADFFMDLVVLDEHRRGLQKRLGYSDAPAAAPPVRVYVYIQSELDAAAGTVAGLAAYRPLQLRLPARQATCRHVKNLLWAARHFAPLRYELCLSASEERRTARTATPRRRLTGQQQDVLHWVRIAAEEPLAWAAMEGCPCVVCEVFWEKQQQGEATPGADAEVEEMDL